MERRFYVYAILLRPTRSETRTVYVGSSALTPAKRFQKHKTEPKGSRHVRERGVRVLGEFTASFRTREEAQAAEKELARVLRKRGWKVYGACSEQKEPTCFL